jgi:hypothetical protein
MDSFKVHVGTSASKEERFGTYELERMWPKLRYYPGM